MKKILMLVLLLSGCSTLINIEIFNNSGLPLVVYGVKAVTINPGEHKKVKFTTSTIFVPIRWNEEEYKYAVDLNSIPGKYVVTGWVYGFKLQIESNFDAYIRKPDYVFSSSIKFLPDEQPSGFPLKPE